MPLFQRKLSHKLLRRRISSSPIDAGSAIESRTGITRRTLLWGAGAAAAVVGHGFNDLTVLASEQRIDVELGAQTWTIMRSDFGRHAWLSHVYDAGRHRILISNAVWPGSNRRIDIDVTIQKIFTEWNLDFKAEGLGRFTALLRRWLGGSRYQVSLVDPDFSIPLGENGHLLQRGPARWSVSPESVWTIEGNLVVVDGSMSCRIECRGLNIQTKSSDFLHNKVSLLSPPTGPVTVITLRDPLLSPIPLWDNVPSALASQISCKTVEQADIVLFDNLSRSAVALLYSSAAEIVIGDDTSRGPIQIGLEKAALAVENSDLIICAKVGRYNQAIDIGNATTVLTGDPNEPLLIDISGSRRSSISVQLMLRELSVPIIGADMATFSFADRPLTLNFCRDQSFSRQQVSQNDRRGDLGFVEYVALRSQPGTRPLDREGPNEILVWRDSNSGNEMCADINVDLEGSRLRLFRARDLLNIGFGFHNLRLECTKDGGRIVPRLVTTGENPQSQRYLLLVYFPPQHIFERAFGVGDLLPTTKEGAVEARLSAPSRIVFDLLGRRRSPLPPNAKPDPIHLTVAELTKWTNYSLAVHDRAQESSVPLSRQLEIAGIVAGDTRGDAFAGIARSLTEPDVFETSIEPAYRMIVSPPASALWSTPIERPDSRTGMDGDYILWHASLDPNQGGKDLRVLWARGVDLDFLFGVPPNDNGWAPPWTEASPLPTRDFVASLKASQRRELMILSSVYGLPVQKDKRYAVPAPPGLTWIVNDQQNQNFEGIFVPKPLQQSNLTLTSIGGSFVGVGIWTPPSRIPGNPQPQWAPDALNLERLGYFSYLASDIFVEEMDKYFSFPYGQNASVLQITRREFVASPQSNETTTYLKQHYHLVFDNLVKTYPAPSHPDQARGIPINTMTMVTDRSPEILDPTKAETRLDSGSLSSNNKIFKPLTAGGTPQDVIFEYQINGDTASAVSPLIFVSNSAAHDPDLMRALVATYNGPAGDPPQAGIKAIPAQFRTVGHGGARRQYAESRKAGDTSFETLTWTLSATGRDLDSLAGGDPFAMNTILEMADQPAFYPILNTAYIRVQSLDRFLGSSAGPIEVQMNRGFVKVGFDGSRNSSEIFLDVLSPAVHLDLSSNGSKSGGVAKPNSRVVALSRKIGMVGGRPSPSAPSGSLARRSAPLLMSGTTNDNYAPDGAAAAMAGQFDPTEFFGGALSDAKLLGLVSLKNILKVVLLSAAPQLIETVGYALNGALAEIRPTLLQGLQQLAQVITEFEAAAKDKVQIGSLTWQQLYPDLAGRLRTFSDAPDSQINSMITALRGASSLTDQAFLAATNNFVKGGNELLSSIDNIVKNPVPALVRDEITAIIQQWNNLRSLGFGDVESAIISSLQQQVEEPINREIGAFCTTLCGGATVQVLQVLLGINPTQCSSIAGDPNVIFQNLSDAFFDETFGSPFLQAKAQLNSALSSAGASISPIQAAARTGNDQLASAIFALVASGANSCLAAGELADISQAVGSIQDFCSQVFVVVRDLAVVPFAKADALQNAISNYEKLLDALDNDFGLWPAQVKQDLVPLQNAARTTLNEAAALLFKIGQARAIAGKLGNQCDFAELKLIQDVFDLRRDATIRVKDLVQNIGSMVDAIASATGGNGNATIGPTLSGLCKASTDLIREITSVSDLASTTSSSVWSELTTLAGQLPVSGSYKANVSNAQQEAVNRAKTLSALCANVSSCAGPSADSRSDDPGDVRSRLLDGRRPPARGARCTGDSIPASGADRLEQSDR
jgi:hypothetical protein